MAAPAFASVATGTASGSTTATFSVPSGVVGKTTDPTELIVIPIYVEDGTQTVTPPDATWFEAGSSPVTLSTGTKKHATRFFYHRASGIESGTYGAFIFAAGLSWRAGFATRYTGVVATGNPFDFTTSAVTDSTSSTTLPAVSGTTTGADRLLLLTNTTFDTATITPPAGFTSRNVNTIDLSDKAQASAGATGSIAATRGAGTTSSTVWLGALKPVGSDSTPPNTSQFFAMF